MTIPARLCKDPLGLVSLMILVLLLAAGLLAPLIAPHDPLAVDAAHKFAGCSAEHWLGTDHLGRDLFSRLLFGVRTTLFLALAIMLPTLVLATLLGLTAGLVRGLPGALILRLCDIMLAFPSSVLILAVVGMLGPGAGNILLACLLAKWPWYTRMIATMARQLPAVQQGIVAIHRAHSHFQHRSPGKAADGSAHARPDVHPMVKFIFPVDGVIPPPIGGCDHSLQRRSAGSGKGIGVAVYLFRQRGIGAFLPLPPDQLQLGHLPGGIRSFTHAARFALP